MIDDIVKCAGVSRGTFYTHFDTVEQAVVEAGAMLADEMVEDVALVITGLDNAPMRMATAILLFLTRARVEEQWGGFIARIGLLREDNKLSQDIRADIASGVESGHYSVDDGLAASDLVFGSAVEGMLRVIEGQVTTRYMKGMSVQIIRSLGILQEDARLIVDESYDRLCAIAPNTLQWWKSLQD